MKSLIDKKEFIAKIKGWGASIVRVADTIKLSGVETDPKDLLNDFPRAVSIAIHLSDSIIDMLEKQPPPLFVALQSSEYVT